MNTKIGKTEMSLTPLARVFQMSWVVKVAVFCMASPFIAIADTDIGQELHAPYQSAIDIKKKPSPGEKLGYSREKSIRHLEPAQRQLLDILLQMYREPGLFTNRLATLQVTGAKSVTRSWSVRYDNMPQSEPTHFQDVLSGGVFARPGWSASYLYDGWREKGSKWYAEFKMLIDPDIECIDSRAVEGYLDLFLQTGLEGLVPSPPPERWDRHGAFGSPYALATGPVTPNLGMVFSKGCLALINVYRGFDYKEIGDELVVD